MPIRHHLAFRGQELTLLKIVENLFTIAWPHMHIQKSKHILLLPSYLLKLLKKRLSVTGSQPS